MRDGTRLNLDQASLVLKKFCESGPSDNIFSSFPFMDQREDILRYTRDSDFFFISQFELMRRMAAENPELLTPPVFYHRKNNRGGQPIRKHYYTNPNRRPPPKDQA